MPAEGGQEHLFEAELYRLRGELLLQRAGHSAASEAESCFRKAIDVSSRQQAKSLELRAVMSLCRLWKHQNNWAEAAEQLAAVYAWFTEGWDTSDLKEARALLVELPQEQCFPGTSVREPA